MISKLFVLATLATVASAWTDFHALNPHHKTTTLPDDRVHVSHDVHHVFPEHGTFFKAKYEGIHHKKWHFVELEEHDVDFMKHVDCGASDQELFVKHPSQKLRAALAKQDFESTVLTAHHQYHCSETAVFRGVTGATYHQETDTLQIHTVQMAYEHVFEHLDLKMETDHFEGKVEDLSGKEVTDGELRLPQPEEETAVKQADGRQMQTAGWFKKAFKKVKKAVTKVVKKVKKVVTKVVTAAKSVVRSVTQIVTGTYTTGKTWPLRSLNYNKDVTKQFEKYQFEGAVRLAASVGAQPSIVFNLRIERMKLELSELYFNVNFQGGIRVAFSSTYSYDNTARKQISLINLQSLSFKIIVIPVVISITCPVNAGYDIDVDGRVNFNFLMAANGRLRMGARYTSTKGFQVINENSLQKTRDFSPRSYRYEVGLQAFVSLQFKASVNFLGFAAATMSLSTEAVLQSNSKCRMLLQMNLQPIMTAQYNLQVKVASRTLISKSYGPKALVSWKVPLINYCIPTRPTYSWWRRSGRHMAIQAATAGSAGETEPVNSPDGVEITKPNDIEEDSTGTTWFGYSDCSGAGALKKTLTFSMQFLPGEYTNASNGRTSTQIILTLSHNRTLSTTTGDYQMTNLQRTYAMNDSLVTGFSGVMRQHIEADPESHYNASVNSTVDPVLIDEHVNIKVDASDATMISVSAKTMFCTTNYIQLRAAEYNDDNTTFTTFSSGGGSEEAPTLVQKLKAYAIYVPILCCLVLAVVVIALVVQRKKAQAVHGAGWAKSEHDVEPIMSQEPAAAAPSGNVNTVPHAPAPTQDARVSAL